METQSKTIGDYTYQVTQLGARQGRRVLVTLFRAIGPAMADLAKAGKGGAEESLAAALGGLARSVTADDLDGLCEAFAASTKVLLPTQTVAGAGTLPQDLSPIFDTHFRGRYSSMIGWLAFAIQVNYSDFFDAAGEGLGGLLRRAPSESPSPKG
jgi:hypothetical protein